ncbi:hypothetical protein ACFPRL_19015 [Pseudoclavibacter helvolus]
MPTTSTVQRSPMRSSSLRDGQSRRYGSHSGSDMPHLSSGNCTVLSYRRRLKGCTTGTLR